MVRQEWHGKYHRGNRMTIFYHTKKALLSAAGFLLVLLLTGCAGGNANVQSAMEMIQALDYQGALTQLEEAQARQENQRLIDRGRGIAYMGLTDYTQAISCFQSALAGSSGLVEPIDFDLNYYLAAAYTKNGQYQEAKNTYDAILALRPQEGDACFLRGSVLLNLGDFEGAKADFDKAVSLAPQNYDRLIEIFKTLEHFGYEEEGRTYLQNALDTGGSSMGQYDTGRIYYYLGEYQQAYMALEEAKQAGGAESYLYLGKAYEATGDYNYASSVYNSYISQDPTNAEMYNQLGLCEMAKGEYQNALAAFQAGLQIEGNEFVQALSFNEIVAYEYLGEYQQAAVLLEKYLQTYPDDTAAMREQQFLSTR